MVDGHVFDIARCVFYRRRATEFKKKKIIHSTSGVRTFFSLKANIFFKYISVCEYETTV